MRFSAKFAVLNPALLAASAATIPAGADGAIDLFNAGSRALTVRVDLTGFCYQYPVIP